MKKLIALGCSILILTACGNEIEKKANEKLITARNAYEHGNYEEAKKQILEQNGWIFKNNKWKFKFY